MPATCHGVIASGALLKLCANYSSLPGSGQDFAPAGVATPAGALSST